MIHPVLESRPRALLYLMACLLLGAATGLLLRLVAGTGWVPSMIFGLPLGLVAAPLSLSAWYLCRAMPLSRTASTRVAATSIVAAVVASSVWAALGQGWLGVLTRSGLALGAVPQPAVRVLLAGVGALGYVVSVTAHYAMQAVEDSAAAERRVLESQVTQREAELRALRAQIDPHFLFNSLNSIVGLIGADPDKARLMCQMLGDFLRDSLRLGGAPRITLGREVDLACQYLAIEQVRFGNRLHARVEVAPEARDVPVPPLMLQPLVENAVRHGIATTLEGGSIEIVARKVGNRAIVSVANPRDPDGGRRGTGLGLELVRGRLQGCFGNQATLVVEAGDAAYRVMLTIPAVETGERARTAQRA